jgi:hypothetical protein
LYSFTWLSVVDGDEGFIFNLNRYEAQTQGIRASLTKGPTQLLAQAKSRGVVMAETQSMKA